MSLWLGRLNPSGRGGPLPDGVRAAIQVTGVMLAAAGRRAV